MTRSHTLSFALLAGLLLQAISLDAHAAMRIKLITKLHPSQLCANAAPEPSNSAVNEYKGGGPLRIAGSNSLFLIGPGLDTLGTDIAVQSGGPAPALDLVLRRVEARVHTCPGGATIPYAKLSFNASNAAGIRVFKASFRNTAGESDSLKIEVHAMPSLSVRFAPGARLDSDCLLQGGGGIRISPQEFQMQLPANAMANNSPQCRARAAAIQTLRLPETLAGGETRGRYHFVTDTPSPGVPYELRLNPTTTSVGSTTYTQVVNVVEGYSYSRDPIGEKPVNINFIPHFILALHESVSGKVYAHTMGGDEPAFAADIKVDSTPAFTTGPEFSPRPPFRSGQNFRVTFNLGSPNPNGETVQYRLDDARCFEAANANTAYAAGAAIQRVSVPARRRAASIDLRVIRDAPAFCFPAPGTPPLALEAWAGVNADLAERRNPFYINGPITIGR